MSAFNIKGTTWHKAFKKSVFETKVTAIDDVDERSVAAIRKAFAGVQLIIIDELSLINLEQLWEINIKLKIACNDSTRQEKLFGGFEDLGATALEDDNETDELENVPKNKKTKDGYLKDGFVVDSSDADESETESSSETDDDDLTEETEEDDKDTDVVIEDIGSELSEESYDYDDDNVAK